MSDLQAVDEATFDDLVLRSDKPVLVDFWAQWCPPCHQIAPLLAQVAAERADQLTVVKLNSDENPEISARYRVMMEERYRERSVALPGAVELVRALKATGMPLAVASSSIRPWVEACLERIGLAGQFGQVVTGSEVSSGKPDPEIYLLTADRLGLPPQHCLAIEDAPAGIESAHAAGMACWAIRTEYTRGLPLPAPDREFESLNDVSVVDIAGVAA